MNWIKRRIVLLGLAAVLITMSVGTAGVASADDADFNDEYLYATTRGVNDMNGVHPGLKLTLYPVTLVVDTAFLPFAVIAGFVTA